MHLAGRGLFLRSFLSCSIQFGMVLMPELFLRNEAETVDVFSVALMGDDLA